MLDEILAQIQPVIVTAAVSIVSILVAFALRSLQKWIDGMAASNRHWKKAGIVIDAVNACWAELGPEALKRVQDGKWTKDDTDALVNMARAKAMTRLKDVTGVVADQAAAWVNDQIRSEVGGLLARLLGLPAAGLTPAEIGPDDPAV